MVSGLVRRTLLPSETNHAATLGGEGTPAPGQCAYSETILRKTVSEVLERAQRIMSEQRDSGGEVKYVPDAPYFGPMEEQYISRKQQPPREEFANAHFSAKYDFLNEFSEDLASTVVGASSNASSSPTGGGAAAVAALGFRAGQGGLLKPGGALVPQPAPAGPNLAQARRVSLAATDPAVGSDGLRRTSKPLALARNHVGPQPGTGGSHFGARKSSSGAGSARSLRGGGGAGGGSKAGLMMINVDELQAIDAEKQSAREKARGKPGRKKAKVDTCDEEKTTNNGTDASGGRVADEGRSIAPSNVGDSGTEGRSQKRIPDEGTAGDLESRAKPPALSGGPMPVPRQGEIEAMAAMMVLGAAGGDANAETSYLPEPLTKLLENANSLRPEGKAKLESFFQKKTPEGSPQERVKYHEEVNSGADGELMRVTSYIRLDYQTWVWDRVHKKKRVRS